MKESVVQRRGRRGEGSLYKRVRHHKDGSEIVDWCFAYPTTADFGMKRTRRVIYARTKTELRAKVTDLRRAMGGTLRPAAAQTVHQHLDTWLEGVARAKPGPTHRFYCSRVAAAKKHIRRGLRLEELTPTHVRALYAALRADGASPDAIEKVHRTLRRAFNVAIGEGLIGRNPCDHVERDTVSGTDRVTLDAAGAAKLLTAARGTAFEAFFVLAVTTAMRPGEIAALQWSDVHLQDGFLTVRATLRDDSGKLSIAAPKAKSFRRIELLAEAVDALNRHKSGSGYVFTSNRGKPIRLAPFAREVFYPLLESAGLPRMRLYDLRHTAVSLFAEAGVHQKIAADVAGHSTEMTMGVYTHIAPGVQREGVEKVGQLLRSRRATDESRANASPAAAKPSESP